MRGIGRQWSELRRFQRLEPKQRSIVFYAEDVASWAHLGPVAKCLTRQRELEICYLTSATNDPILTATPPRIRPFFIGDGIVRTIAFLCMRANLVVMTMPDLDTFHVKHSRLAPAHYVYVFHSLVSTHMVYRPGAFDHFDTILCAGPHHVAEIRETEKLHGLKPKNLLTHGYCRLDALMTLSRKTASTNTTPTGPRRVLLAPSWGPNGLLETHAHDAVNALLSGGYLVTVRPHPMTVKKRPEVIDSLAKRYDGNPRFVLETDVASSNSLRAADVMISDWSGAALEYALAFERPVLFLDVPRKVNNPGYERLGIEPIEVALRNEIGVIVSPDNMHELPAAIERMCRNRNAWTQRIRSVRDRIVFNPGTSADAGAAQIADLAQQIAANRDTTATDLAKVTVRSDV